jgi:hypothetical protein
MVTVAVTPASTEPTSAHAATAASVKVLRAASGRHSILTGSVGTE